MKKKVAIIVNRMAFTGAARMASKLSIHLSDEKYEKMMIVFDDTDSTYEVKGNLINLGIKATKNPVTRVIRAFKSIKRLKNIKKENGVDITISFTPTPNIINILSRVNDKVIVSERSFMSSHFSGVSKLVFKVIYKLFYRKADRVVAVSKVVKDDLVRQFGVPKKNIDVIYNFYNVEEIKLLANEKIDEKNSILFNKPTIITSGRLMYQKGHWHLIRAFNKVKKEINDVQLVIMGDEIIKENLKLYLQDLVKEYNMVNNVHFIGFQKNPFKFLAKSDVFVFPSLFEGFPNALNEAMACGIPVISADCESGPREILDPRLSVQEEMINEIHYAQYGMLVPTCDGVKYNASQDLSVEEEMLADGIVELMKNKTLRDYYKTQARIRVKHFQKNEIIGKWEKIIDG